MKSDDASPPRQRRVWVWIVACVAFVVAAAVVFLWTYEHSFWFDRTSGFMTGTYKIAGVRVWSYAEPTRVSEMLSSTFDETTADRRYVGTSFFGGVACGMRGGSYTTHCHRVVDAIASLDLPNESSHLLRAAMARLDDVTSHDWSTTVVFETDINGHAIVGRAVDGTILFRVSTSDE